MQTKINKMKKRAICFLCKAKKYLKYLDYTCRKNDVRSKVWVCKNREKCFLRGANYKK